MSQSAAVEKMIHFYKGSLHDISHFLKVYAFAKTIGEQEGLDAATQEILELSAILHDIACPLCREKYGKAMGSYQELEGGPLARVFLEELEYPQHVIDRTSFIVAHHHTYSSVDGLDYQILLEADFLVNADEGKHSLPAIESARDTFFRTETGIRLLNSAYKLK